MAGGDDLKLFGSWASPHVLRLRLALRLKDLSYEYTEEEQDPKNSNSEELLLNRNLPVLVHGGKPVYGTSLSLIQYVDETFTGAGSSLLPDNPLERAAARYWGDFIDDKLINAMHKATWGVTFSEKEEGQNQAAAALETLEGTLREDSPPFFGGDSIGYVDVVLGGLLPWVHAIDEIQAGVKAFDPTYRPLLAAWNDRFCALKEVQALTPCIDELLDLVMAMPTCGRACQRSSGQSLQVIVIIFSLLMQIVGSCS